MREKREDWRNIAIELERMRDTCEREKQKRVRVRQRKKEIEK